MEANTNADQERRTRISRLMILVLVCALVFSVARITRGDKPEDFAAFGAGVIALFLFVGAIRKLQRTRNPATKSWFPVLLWLLLIPTAMCWAILSAILSELLKLFRS